MSNTQPTDPTEPLPPYQGHTPPPGPAAPGVPAAPAAGVAAPVVPEPFYKRHGLAFAISTLVLSIVVLLGLVTAGSFAVANVVSHLGERAISRVVPGQGHGQPGVPGMPGRPGDGGGNGKGDGQQGGGEDQKGRVLLRGTIASISGDTWTIDRDSGSSVDVRVTSSTVFGTPKQSASKSDFATGDEVIVIAKRADDSVTATRVLKLDAFPTRPPSTPGTPQTPGS
ncbi:DUF5666 domain-containing protein [Leifsonia sp. 1010]|uniref:DUF5666 domain-containing protein n=1 Tax=Leifsonia sp. 1010 TaxID=2817769 RepID=UPI0028620C2A|nr:DUF5666 domain-containing protein [Leifsonia sp. 1010]MDR6612822.1 hypothetical protein [Leifsonia sp. 1010]